MNQLMELRIQKIYKSEGLKGLREAMEKTLPQEHVMVEILSELADENFAKFKIQMLRIKSNLGTLFGILGSNEIYENKTDLIEIGNLIMNEAKKIIELGLEVKK